MSTPPALNRSTILTQCRVTAEGRLAQVVGPLLDAAATLLAELGEHAKGMQDREQFIGGASRLRNQRDVYLAGFRKGYAERFDAAASALLRGGPGWEELDRETAAMLRTNVLENEVAILKLGVRLKEAARDDLAELSARFVTLFRLQGLDDGDNPLGPAPIAHGVYAGLVAARVEGKAARALRPLLEDRLRGPVRELYQALNRMLESLGIAPHVPHPHAPAAVPPAVAPAPIVAAAAVAPAVTLAAETAAARRMVAMVRERGVPETLLPFLRHGWVRVLALAYDAGGESGSPWQAAVRTLEDLLWSIEAKPDAAARARLRALLPDLLRRIGAGMDQVALPPADRGATLDALMAIHRALLQEPVR
jgi:hypothetical protein